MELLAALLGALIGSVSAYLGAWRLQNLAADRADKAAGRAVFSEVIQNGAIIGVWLHAPREAASHSLRLSTRAWDSHAGAMAMSVKPAAYQALMFAFELVPFCHHVVDLWRTRDPLEGEWEMVNEALAAFDRAANAMRPHVWSEAEASELHTAAESMQAGTFGSAPPQGDK